MFAPLLLERAPDVDAIVVDGGAGARIDLALPELLERLSIALHRHDTGVNGPLFRSLAAGGTSAEIRRRARTLLAQPRVREALTLTVAHDVLCDFVSELEDAGDARYYGPDDEPLEQLADQNGARA